MTRTTIGTLAGTGRTGRRAALGLVSLTAVAALLAGCGGDDEPAATPSATPSASASASASAGAAGSDTGEAAEVRKAYVAFEQAGSEQDSGALAELISASTLDYFDSMRDLALTAEKAQLTKERVVDQITVLGMRAKVDPKVLRDGTPKELLAASSAGGGSVPSTGLSKSAKITVSGDKATATDPTNPQATLTFVKEDGAWKADVTSIFGQLEETVAPLVQQAGGDKAAFVEQSMAGQVGGPAQAKALWKPIGG
jgi:hypothetical protein